MQAYLNTIKAKTGMDVADFTREAVARGVTPCMDAVPWLNGEFGPGHANLIAQPVPKPGAILAPQADKIADLFAGKKSRWRPVCDALMTPPGLHCATIEKDCA